MDQGNKIEVGFDPADISGKYLESRKIELSLLTTLLDLCQEVSTEGPQTNPNKNLDKRTKEFLDSLEAKYNDWQTYTNNSRQGLNSGPTGEVFMRMIGTGILYDLPDLVKTDSKHTVSQGVEIISSTANKNQQGIIEATVKVRNTKDVFYRFRFNMNVEDLQKRIETLNEEFDKGMPDI